MLVKAGGMQFSKDCKLVPKRPRLYFWVFNVSLCDVGESKTELTNNGFITTILLLVVTKYVVTGM